jgi:hypothetical protein
LRGAMAEHIIANWKKNILRVGIFFGIFVGIWLVARVVGIQLDFENMSDPNFVNMYNDVHFAIGGNDFGGSFFRLGVKNLSGNISVEDAQGEQISCDQQLKGLYYNNQRGQRLWPIDLDTLASLQSFGGYTGLNLTWAWYTNCVSSGQDISTSSIFGQIDFDYLGTQSSLLAGIGFSFASHSYVSSLTQSFHIFQSQFPLGYIFDTVGGIAFVWGLLSGDHQDVLADIAIGSGVDEIFVASGTEVYASGDIYNYLVIRTWLLLDQWRLGIVWSVGLTPSLTVQQRQEILDSTDDSLSAFSVDAITIVDIFNRLRIRRQQLCGARVAISLISDDNPVLCMIHTSYDPDNLITINLADTTSYSGKIIFVRYTDVILQGSMPYNAPALQLFVDKGNVYRDAVSSDSILIDANGYPVLAGGITKGLYIFGNIVIYGLFVPGDGASIDPLDNKVYMHGTVISLNTPNDPDTIRRDHIVSVLDSTNYNSAISLENLSSWRCTYSISQGSDGVDCLPDDRFRDKSVVIIDSYISSLLF